VVPLDLTGQTSLDIFCSASDGKFLAHPKQSIDRASRVYCLIRAVKQGWPKISPWVPCDSWSLEYFQYQNWTNAIFWVTEYNRATLLSQTIFI